MLGETPPSNDELVRQLIERLPARASGETPRPRTEQPFGLSVAADLLSRFAVDHQWTADEVDTVIATASSWTGIPEDVTAELVCRHALRDVRLLEYPPRMAIEAELRLLRAFTQVESVSLWVTGASGRVSCLQAVGDRPTTRRTRVVAQLTVQGLRPRGPVGFIHAIPILRWQRPAGALVVRTRPGDVHRVLPLMTEAAAMLTTALERDMLLARNAERERSVSASSEKRLVRLGFDLHDGPIQDLVALAGDLNYLRRKAAREGDAEALANLLEQMGELEARIREVDHGLRELAHSLEPASLYGRTFEQLLKHEVTSFSSRTEIEADLTATGDFSTLSASQRFALLLVVKEALSNVREHSAATAARVTVTVRRDRIEGEIWDNGQGFAVERALVRAAKNGRLGLVGMGERMRLLGGKLEIHSHPGGPTLTRFTIPAWQPLVAGDQQFARRHGESISVRA
ncbi:MAG: hypothetical protein QOH73_472 [Gaiellaceae bacterium]|jgi:signal transduction histidine kinase|nr:hypothetical protein [Gaiellaceae bacterium]